MGGRRISLREIKKEKMKNPVVLLQCMSRDQIAAAIDKIKEGRTMIITDPPMYVFFAII